MNRKFIQDITRYNSTINPEDLFILESITEGTHALTYQKLLENLNIPDHITIDSALSVDSTNPVQNKAIFAKFVEVIESVNELITTVNNLDIPNEVLVDTVLDPESTNAIENKAITVAIINIRESINNLQETINNLNIPEEIIVDEELSNDSTNPIQNKVVSTAVNNLQESINNLNTTIENLNIPDAITIDSTLSAESENPVQNKVINTVISIIQETINNLQETINNLNIPEEIIIDAELNETSTNPVQNSTLVVKLNEITNTINEIQETINNLNIPDAITIDSTLSAESENPIQNKVVTNKFDELSTSLDEFNTTLTNLANTVDNLNIPDAITIDSTLSAESENPVQNKVVNTALEEVRQSIPDVDTELSEFSENPIQNKVVNTALNGIQETINNLNIPDAITIDTELLENSNNPLANAVIFNIIRNFNQSILLINKKIETLEKGGPFNLSFRFQLDLKYAEALDNIFLYVNDINKEITDRSNITLNDLQYNDTITIVIRKVDNSTFNYVNIANSSSASAPVPTFIQKSVSETNDNEYIIKFKMDKSYSGIMISVKIDLGPYVDSTTPFDPNHENTPDVIEVESTWRLNDVDDWRIQLPKAKALLTGCIEVECDEELLQYLETGSTSIKLNIKNGNYKQLEYEKVIESFVNNTFSIYNVINKTFTENTTVTLTGSNSYANNKDYSNGQGIILRIKIYYTTKNKISATAMQFIPYDTHDFTNELDFSEWLEVDSLKMLKVFSVDAAGISPEEIADIRYVLSYSNTSAKQGFLSPVPIDITDNAISLSLSGQTPSNTPLNVAYGWIEKQL